MYYVRFHDPLVFDKRQPDLDSALKHFRSVARRLDTAAADLRKALNTKMRGQTDLAGSLVAEGSIFGQRPDSL